MPRDPFMVISDLYNRIFTVQTSHIDLLVDYAEWNRIFERLPQDYKLPDMKVLNFD
ncbi:hypothetical protein G8C92_18535 [Paenibacillus donghaensis]|uniref:hypothetical protein n=1 Tax=Paenibacillus donghaensis TaxID=414771 RepID=UPI001883F0E8|nr:hypothetical protein [Paenibacillus donghaensis]MBE9916015.1 hypothetical protein [Paenibacillus donghaensis]